MSQGLLQKSISVSERNKSGSIKLSPGALVCLENELRGDITIGNRTIIHPRSRIIAEAGPIIIGEGNLIEEQAEILNLYPTTMNESQNPPNQTVMIIGNNNIFEVASYTEALNIGDNNVIECKARIGRNLELSNGCIIGAMCDVNTVEVLPENTVIYGEACHRRVQLERPSPQTLQLDFLMKILPNYHHIRKAQKVMK